LDIVNKINNELNFEQIINKNNYFIASFSYEINNVTLFDRYAENAEGVAIGFDTKHDWQNINENFWIKNYDFMKLLPVIYDKTIQQKIIEYGFYIYKIVKEWLFNAKNAYNSQNNLITNEKKEAGLESLFLRYLEETISFFKHSAFLDEREVRLLYTYDYDFIKKYELHIDKKKFNNKNYYTSTDTHDMSFENYHEFSQEKYKIKLPIKNIVLGSRVKNKEQIVNQIKEQCQKFGFQNVDIQISDIPLR
ncbi:DUF2971 domain-containing protein, partial [Sulfurimonas sp. RIFOXYB12_FULL_35_9]|uniref:DUF2971 domain-containing protein n=1 Tax=Sulfurimonas sp. RIFOXYB12_FULL_35_9 TaxID=1802256 RepID=UPI0025D49EB1